MKKTITSAGLLVLGATSLQAQYAPAPELTTTELSKPWSVAASLRGFYDDNYLTQVKDLERDSFGFEIAPSVGLNWTMQQTYVGLSYLYGLRYYEDDSHTDQSHQINAKLSHMFTERYKLDLSDAFVMSREPEIVNGGIPLRTEGDNIRNSANATFSADLTEDIGTVLGYTNNYYNYEEENYSPLLDRVEHLIMANLRWRVQRETVGILGYQYGIVDYTKSNALFDGDVRDNNSHYAYVGLDQSVTATLDASIRVGAQFTEYDEVDEDTVSPYVDGNATWRYRPDSYFQLGVKHTRNATDIVAPEGGLPTLDQETTTIYSSLNHRITPKLTGSLLGQFQHGTFESGAADDQDENWLMAGLNLSYEINKFLSAETGYNFDRLDSDVGRSYTRNRVYIGIRGSY